MASCVAGEGAASRLSGNAITNGSYGTSLLHHEFPNAQSAFETQEELAMKIRTVLLTTAMLAMASGAAFAQASSAPAGAPGAPGAPTATTPPQMQTPATQSQDKNASPASPNSGIKQEK
jgi:hypothetical protein